MVPTEHLPSGLSKIEDATRGDAEQGSGVGMMAEVDCRPAAEIRAAACMRRGVSWMREGSESIATFIGQD